MIAVTAEEAAAEAAGHIADCLREAIAARGRAMLALSGGSSPVPLFRALATEPLDWRAVHVFQVDERVAPALDPARNINAIAEHLVGGGALPGANLHTMPVAATDLGAAAADYAQIMGGLAGEPPVLDVVQLGLGADGHTASLFPGEPALGEAARSVAVTGLLAGYRRMTLTLPVLNRARRRVWFVTGGDKATVLDRLRRDDLDAPAGRVARVDAIIFADVAAGRTAT